MEDMAVIAAGAAPKVPASETETPVLPAMENHRMTGLAEEKGPPQSVPGEPGEWLSVNHLSVSTEKRPEGLPTRSDNPILPEADQDHGRPENRQAGAYHVQGAGDMAILAKAVASAATSADPPPEPDDGAAHTPRPTPVDASMVKAGEEKDGTRVQIQAEGETEILSLGPIPGEKTMASPSGTRGHQTAQGPDTPLPSRDAPIPPHPAMPEKNPSQPVSLPQMDPQAEKQPAADVAGAVAAPSRRRHMAGKTQMAHNRSSKPPSAEGRPEKIPAPLEGSLSGRLALNRPQTASLAGSPDIGRPAHDTGPRGQQPVVPAMPPAGQVPGQVAGQPSMAAAPASTTISPTLDDGAALRLELPLWSAAGNTAMPVNENQDIRPGADLPPASREMRMLSDVIEKAYWHQKDGRAQARIQIKPAFLGHLHLNVLTDQARVSVEIRVESPMAREFIEMNLQTLKTDLQESGLEIDRIDVVVDRDADDSREPHREPARKQNRRPDTPHEMVETAPPDHEAALPETDKAENSINTFA